ncbi:TPA: hypothetical protein VBN14_001760 [Streptococcus agalactiae]|nr:hypothetical protein [Streptococcus agalactiae]HEO7923667.1 hypothetical protein [Streptococcus agalactiae]
MINNFNNKIQGVYGWKVENGKVAPPKHILPEKVIERADYFWEMTEDGLTFLGAMDYIFMDEKPKDYDTFATKEWLETTKEFNEWFRDSPSMAQAEIAIYLLFGNNEEVKNDK